MAPAPAPAAAHSLPAHWLREVVPDNQRSALEDFLPDDNCSLAGSELTDSDRDEAGTEADDLESSQAPDDTPQYTWQDDKLVLSQPPPASPCEQAGSPPVPCDARRVKPPKLGFLPPASQRKAATPAVQPAQPPPSSPELPATFAYEPPPAEGGMDEDAPLPECTCSQMLSLGMPQRTRGPWMASGLYQQRPECPLCTHFEVPGESTVMVLDDATQKFRLETTHPNYVRQPAFVRHEKRSALLRPSPVCESDWPIEVRLCYQDVKTRMAKMAQRNVKTVRGHKVLDTQLGKLQLELDAQLLKLEEAGRLTMAQCAEYSAQTQGALSIWMLGQVRQSSEQAFDAIDTPAPEEPEVVTPPEAAPPADPGVDASPLEAAHPDEMIVYSYEDTLRRLAKALGWYPRDPNPTASKASHAPTSVESFFLNAMGHSQRGRFVEVPNCANVLDQLRRVPGLTFADRLVLQAGWNPRRKLLDNWTRELPHLPFPYWEIGPTAKPAQTSQHPIPSPPPDVATQPAVQQPPAYTKFAASGKRTASGNARQKHQKLEFPAPDRTGATAAERDQKTYETLVHHIIEKTVGYCKMLTDIGVESSPFGHVLSKNPTASPEDVATVYGQLITGRRGGGAVQLSGLKQRWSRIRRFLESVVLHEDRGVLHTCRFIDTSNYKGFGAHLRWAGAAFHLDWIKHLAEQELIKYRSPGKAWVPARGKLSKSAPHLPDDFLRFLADQCRHPNPIRRRKAFYVYQCGMGGVRFSDTENVIRMSFEGPKDEQGRYMSGACIAFTASRFKTSRGETMEYYALPLHDYTGASLAEAALDLQAQMGGERGGFLLAASLDPRDIESDVKRDDQGCTVPGSYWESTLLVRHFVDLWVATLPAGSPLLQYKERYAKATIHSFKGWLDTFAVQAKFQQDDIDTLLHWSNKAMRRHYNRCPQATEVHMRQKVVALLASGWNSTGVGFQMQEPPDLRTIKPVTVRF